MTSKRNASSRTRVKKAASRTRAARSGPIGAASRERLVDEHVDGCDIEFLDSEATPDEALPAATGGVQAAAPPSRRGTRRPDR